MNSFEITIPIEVLTRQELSAEELTLINAAADANLRAYAPYSKFSVGAAILLDNGEIITGANQENAAYPSGTCAERTACYYAYARYPKSRFLKIAITARGTDECEVAEPISPCGACRQALLEYEKLAGHNITVILVGKDKIYRLPSVKSLLPLAFAEF